MPHQRKRRKHDAEFRRSTVQLVLDGQSLAQVGRDLELSTSVISRWRRELLANGSSLVGPKNHLPGANPIELVTEIDRLRRKLAVVEQEREILKKAISIIHRET